MTKIEKTFIFFINMRITAIYVLGQLTARRTAFFCVFAAFCFFSSCTAKGEEIPVIPPETSPLTGGYIGYGVITASFTHISFDPSENSGSLGYLRRGILVKVLRRQILNVSGSFISWVLVDAQQGQNENDVLQGWLKEEVMEIYSYESQARTAAETMLR